MQVLVVANPANTNALILKEFAPSIPEKNITCLTRLDHNRALGQISEKLNVYVSDVKNVIIWGNHSSTQYPDVNHATVAISNGQKSVRELVADDNWYLNFKPSQSKHFQKVTSKIPVHPHGQIALHGMISTQAEILFLCHLS